MCSRNPTEWMGQPLPAAKTTPCWSGAPGPARYAVFFTSFLSQLSNRLSGMGDNQRERPGGTERSLFLNKLFITSNEGRST